MKLPELPVLQASDGEEDNERSVRRFGYNPDNGDVWGEYQPAVGDPMFACYLDLHGNIGEIASAPLLF